jgi:hypothetical protein
MYNLGVHHRSDSVAIVCIWLEDITFHDSNEIASCLLKAIGQMSLGKQKIIFHSDSCPE